MRPKHHIFLLAILVFSVVLVWLYSRRRIQYSNTDLMYGSTSTIKIGIPPAIVSDHAAAITFPRVSNYNRATVEKVNVITGAPRTPIILLYHKLHGSRYWFFGNPETAFDSCEIKCELSADTSDFTRADLVMFEAPREVNHTQQGDVSLLYYGGYRGIWPQQSGNPGQVRLFYARESQTAGLSGKRLQFAQFAFNYTMTFLEESDVFFPYGYITRKTTPNKQLASVDYSKNKTSNVLWIVSNCRPQKRWKYYEELRKYVQVDLFGACSNNQTAICKNDLKCTVDLMKKYKFYLAFENCLCREYLTEKFWKPLHSYTVPIVMGAAKKVYERVAPPNSFIHVDDFTSPQELAEFIAKLNMNDAMYSEYHRWRSDWSLHWGNPNCQVCSLAHEKPERTVDITSFWNSDTDCIWP